MEIIGYLFSIGSVVCWIMVLVKMFQTAGVLQGILGIICALWAFIWGWMNASKTNQKNVMIAWTVCIVAGMVVQFMLFDSGAA